MSPSANDSATDAVRPFSNGSEAMDWQTANCERCQRNGYRLGSVECPMEHAVSLGFLLGSVPVALAVEYGATIAPDDAPFCEMPRQCAQFVPPATCEFVQHPNARRRGDRQPCTHPATTTRVANGLTRAVCEGHAKACDAMDAKEAAAVSRSSTRREP